MLGLKAKCSPFFVLCGHVITHYKKPRIYTLFMNTLSSVNEYVIIGQRIRYHFPKTYVIYNVMGQRLTKMQQGINMVNGKKVLKK